jgi:hypothetical protein
MKTNRELFETKVNRNLKNPGQYAPVKTLTGKQYRAIKKRETATARPFIPEFS